MSKTAIFITLTLVVIGACVGAFFIGKKIGQNK
jgi:hypothetical protein